MAVYRWPQFSDLNLIEEILDNLGRKFGGVGDLNVDRGITYGIRANRQLEIECKI